MLERGKIKKVLQLLEKTHGDTGTALVFRSPFQLLVSTMLAAQSTDVQVNKITASLFQKFPGPYEFSRLTAEQLENEIKSVGLYRNKAKNIVVMSRILVERYGGEVPPERDVLESLPGVGRKTANVVLSVGFDIPAFAVDTHVFRVSNRIGLAESGDVVKTELQLMDNIPESKWNHAHHWLIWHGRRICKARNPLCAQCPVNQLCQGAFPDNHSPAG